MVPGTRLFCIAYIYLVAWPSLGKDTSYRDKSIVIAGTSTTSRLTIYLIVLGSPSFIFQGWTKVRIPRPEHDKLLRYCIFLNPWLD